MRLILSRKGFDRSSGGCPSPIFPDRSMIALPIPDRTSPVRYRDIVWRGSNLGEVVEALTRGKVRGSFGAHLDPDLREELRPRPPGWRPLLGQHAAAQGHLRNHGVGPGDLFLFWGLFREVDDELAWAGPPIHVVWGWLEVGEVAAVDASVRTDAAGAWRWVADHPHLAFPPDPANTLYVGADRLSRSARALPGSGVFEHLHVARRLTAAPGGRPGTWRLPLAFLPGSRKPLSYHARPERWTRQKDNVLLESAARGQEFVLDGDAYPEVVAWAIDLIATTQGGAGSETRREP